MPSTLKDVLSSLRSLFKESLARQKGFVLLASVFVGLLAGLAAVLLKRFCELFHGLSSALSGDWWAFWLLPALPGLGILACTALVALFVKGRYEKGLSGVIAATSRGTSDLPSGKVYSHVVTSGICVGLGGSAGLEAPIALTGSAIGSNLAKSMGISGETRTLLLACGGAAGIAAIFSSPVGGALFACEVLLPEFSIPALVPLLMSSAAASVLSSVLYSKQPFIALSEGWNLNALPFYVVLGIVCGLVAVYVMRASSWIGRKLERFKGLWAKAIVGAVALYLSFLLLPCLAGEGYDQIASIVTGKLNVLFASGPLSGIDCGGWLCVGVIAVLILAKALVSAMTIESGGDGGIFAPSMFTGAFTGLFLSRAVNLSGFMHLNEVNFIAVGMGGLLSGVMHAPMTGIFLIAEITGGYKLLVPLMIVSALACFTCRRLEPYNVYKRSLHKAGFPLEPNPDTAAIEAMNLSELVETDFLALKEGDTLRDMIRAIMASRRNVFPVVDGKGRLAGIVTLDNLRPFLLDSQLYDMALVYDVMSQPGPTLKEGDSLAGAARLFEKCGLWNIPVEREDGSYLGFVSKSGVFDKYRELLRNKPELF